MENSNYKSSDVANNIATLENQLKDLDYKRKIFKSRNSR